MLKSNKFYLSTFRVVMICGLIFGLAGCSAGDVQLEGKIFEAAGLTNLGKKAETPKVKERSPLVLPPQAALPEPGKQAVAPDDMNWPDDPDLKLKTQKAAIDAERQKYCADVGKNEQDPYYDAEKAQHCDSLLSKALSNAFGRAPEQENN